MQDEKMLIPIPEECERVWAFMRAKPPFTGWVKHEEPPQAPEPAHREG